MRLPSLVLVAVAALAAWCSAPLAATPAPTGSWAVGMGGTGLDISRAVLPMPDGSTVVTGSFSGTATFGGTTLTSAGDHDIFVTRINRDGTHAWAVRAGGSQYDVGFSLTAAPDGGLIFSAIFTGTQATFGSRQVTGAGGADVAVAEMDPSTGAFLWVTTGGGTGNDYLYRIRALPDGSFITVGSHQLTATFGSTTLPTSLGAGDLFAARINADGSFRWAKRLGGSVNFDDLFGLWLFPDGTFAASGYIRDSATFGGTTLAPNGGSGADVLVLKMDADGNVLWARRAGGPGTDDFGYGLSGFPDGSMLVVGYFSGTADFGSFTRTSAGGTDAFVAKYSPDGAVQWVRTGGGTGADEVRDVVARADGSALIAGTFASTFQFGAISLTSAGNSDVFAAVLDDDGDATWSARRGGSGADGTRYIAARPDGFFTTAGFFSSTAAFGATTLTSRGDWDAFAEGFLSVPDAPARPVITTGPGYATVTVDPSDSPSVTRWDVTAQPGGHACTILPPATGCTLSGLDVGTEYVFTVVATNATGNSSASEGTTAVIPDEPAQATPSPVAAPAGATVATARAIGPFRARVWRIGFRAITAGMVPEGATSIVQGVRRNGGSAAARGTRPPMAVRPCVIRGQGGQRTFRCVRMLSPGTWRVITEARAPGAPPRVVSARLVVHSAARPAVTG